jgi:hypothetical protein
VKQKAYNGVAIHRTGALRIHGVSPELSRSCRAWDTLIPEPDDLVAMRIHNGTPEYISGLHSRGLQNLSVDQLVNMRIHGID